MFSIVLDRPLAILSKLTALALFGAALAFAILLLTILFSTGTMVLPLLIVSISLLLVSGIVTTGLRWTPLLGALLGLGTLIGGVFTQQYFVYHLTHPAEVSPFLLCLLVCLFSVVSICTGIGATIQNYRGERSAPSWLPLPFSALAGFVLGAALVAIIVAATPQPPTATAGASATPVVHMGISTFSQPAVTVSKGASLKLVDDGQFTHVLNNGSWLNGTPHQAAEPDAPSIQNVNINGNSIVIGPFNTAGTFHIYCTIHPGMNLVVNVQ